MSSLSKNALLDFTNYRYLQGFLDEKPRIYKTHQLAKELKSLCYANGKERDVKQSAKVIHQLSRAYHEIADELPEGRDKKISLIRSAVLLNAAIVRKPDNVAEVEKDLDKLCSCVLQLAGSHDTSVDSLKQLVVASVTKIKDLRLWVKNIALRAISLAETDQCKAHLIKSLQITITDKYKLLMANIMEFCVEATGPAPCKYALVGMGSLARNEITPYSDFEHIYLLEEGVQNRPEYEEILEYFRWVSVMFQVVVVNFGETIIPHVSLPFINDPEENNGKGWFFDAHTPRGISFDGMVTFACKFPLGRPATPNKPWDTELIKPVSEMLQYLGQDIDLKNGYHLGDILTKISFVCGDDTIYDQMKAKTTDILQQRNFEENYIKLLKEDTVKFNIDECLRSIHEENSVNIKSVVFRSITLFIAALGRKHNCISSSSFDILRELTPSQISLEQSDDFMFALAFACEVRLRVYLKYSSQCDYLDARFEPFHDLLLKVFGRSRIALFFSFVSNLQMHTTETPETKESTWIRVIQSIMCLRLYDEAIVVIKNIKKKIRFESEAKAMIYHCESLCYSYLNQHKAALECYEEALSFINPQQVPPVIFHSMGTCYSRFGQHLKAIHYLEKVLRGSIHKDGLKSARCELFRCYVKADRLDAAQDMIEDVLNDNIMKFTARYVAEYYYSKCMYEKSIEYCLKHVFECKKMAFDESSDHATAVALLDLAESIIATDKYTEAVKVIKQVENILKSKYYVSTGNTPLPARCKWFRAEICFYHKKYQLARILYKEAYDLYPSREDYEKKFFSAKMYFSFGVYHFNNNKYECARKQFEKSILACEGRTDNNATWVNANAHSCLGLCLKHFGLYKEASKKQEVALAMSYGLQDVKEKGVLIRNCLMSLVECSFELKEYDKVLAYYDKMQGLLEQLPLENNWHTGKMSLFYSVGRSYKQLGQLENAVECLENVIQLSMQDPSLQGTSFVANCRRSIHECRLQMERQ